MAITINGDGTLTGISVGGLPDGIVDTDMLAADAVTGAKIGSLPAGSILQVKQTVKTDTDTTTSQESYGDVTGMSVSITPSSDSNKILIQIALGRVGSTSANRTTMFRIMRGTTAIAIGDTAGVRSVGTFATSDYSTTYSPGGAGFTFLDSPSTTSATTYKLQWSGQAGETHRLNGSGSNADNVDAPHTRCVSTITVMEVAG